MNNTQKMLLILSMVIGSFLVYYHFYVNIEKINEGGQTELYRTIETNDIDAVAKYLQKNVNVNHVDTYGQTPLQFVTQMKKHKNTGEIAQLLIDAGADTSVRNEQGYSLLHMAVDKRNDFVAKVLMDAGLDVNEQDLADGSTVLHKAIVQASIAALKDYQGLVTCPCCVEAMFSKSLAIAQSALQAGVDTTIKNQYGHTAQDIIDSMLAKVDARHDQSDLYYKVEDLIEKPEDFNVKITEKFDILKKLFI